MNDDVCAPAQVKDWTHKHVRVHPPPTHTNTHTHTYTHTHTKHTNWPLTVVFSLHCACSTYLKASPVSLVVLAIRLALFFIVTPTHIYTQAYTKTTTTTTTTTTTITTTTAATTTIQSAFTLYCHTRSRIDFTVVHLLCFSMFLSHTSSKDMSGLFLNMCHDIARGMAYLSSRGFVHRVGFLRHLNFDMLYVSRSGQQFRK